MDPIFLLAAGFLGGLLASTAKKPQPQADQGALSGSQPDTWFPSASQVTDPQIREYLEEAQGIDVEPEEIEEEIDSAESRFLSFADQALNTAIARAVKRERMGVEQMSWQSIMGQIPGLTEALAMYFMMTDDKVPWTVRAEIASALLYLVSPIDVIPEAEVGPAGYIDDAAIIYTVFKRTLRHLRTDHFRQAQAFLRQHGIEPKPWGSLGVPIEMLEWAEYWSKPQPNGHATPSEAPAGLLQ